jgi:hypothetical protein
MRTTWTLVAILALTPCLSWGNDGEEPRIQRQRFTGVSTVLNPTPTVFVGFVQTTLNFVQQGDRMLRGVYRCKELGGQSHFCPGPRGEIDPTVWTSSCSNPDGGCPIVATLTARFPDGHVCVMTASIPFDWGEGAPAISGPYSCTDAAGAEVARGFMGVVPAAAAKSMAAHRQCVGNCGP